MEFHFSHFVTIVLLFVLIILILRYYWNFKKKCSGFPFFHLIPSLIYDHINGRISKEVPLNTVAFQKLIQTGKQYMREGLFMTYATRPVLIILSGEAIKAFSNEKAALDKSPEYALMQDIVGAGILTSNGERWKTHRKMIHPAFHMGVLKEKVSLFNEHAVALIKDMDKLAGKPTVNLLGTLKCHYYYALSESVLGLKQSKENEAELLKLVGYVDSLCAMVVKRILYPWLRLRFVLKLFPFGKEFYRQLKAADDFVTNLISEMKKHVYYDKTMNTELFGSHLRKSFAYILLNRHLNDPSFTFQDIHDEVKTIMAAGYDTMTYSTLWCLFLLGWHPEVQEKAYSEVLSKTSDYITYEESSNLVYLESIIMETLRLYPTVPILARNLSKDVQFGKYKVFKDTTIAFLPYVSNRDPKIYPDPEHFYPERFLSGDMKFKNLIPFSEGTRSCIGKNYALMQMKIILGHILRNFEITSLDRREDVDLSWEILLTPVKPLHIKITRRRNKLL